MATVSTSTIYPWLYAGTYPKPGGMGRSGRLPTWIVEKASRLKRKHGLTLHEYQALLDAQGNLCGLCGKPETKRDVRTGEVLFLQIDHDHRCCPKDHSCNKCRRGLLCSRCNIALGNFDDSAELLQKASVYLKSYEKENV